MKTIKDYYDLYLKFVLLLADVFNKFKNNSLKNYGLSLTHYLSAPTLSWDGVLHVSKVEVELILDADIYFLFKKGMRCGVSYISKRYCKAKNKYLES